MWNAVWEFWRVLESWKCMEVCKSVQRYGNRVAEFRYRCFCLDYVSKNGVSVMEHNTMHWYCALLSVWFWVCLDEAGEPPLAWSGTGILATDGTQWHTSYNGPWKGMGSEY